VQHNRAMLIRIAEIYERMDSAQPGQRESLIEERTRLVSQVRAG
jgi:hypothetical protein